MKRPIVHLVAPSAGGMLAAATGLTAKLRQRGQAVAWLGPLPRPQGGRWWPSVTLFRQTAASIRRLQPAIIHAHGLRAAWLVRTLVRRGMLGHHPLVTTLHNFPFHDPAAQRLPTRLWRLLEPRPPLPDRYICVSRALGRWFQRRSPSLASRTVVIPYVTPRPSTDFLERGQARQRLGLPCGPGQRYIGAISRCSPEKGLALLLGGFRGLVATGRLGAQWHLVIIGEGPQRTQLQRHVQRYGLQGRVHFTGHVPDAGQYIRALDICVVPSRSEGFGLTAFDAVAAGVPLVASRVGGLVEVLNHGRHGLLVEPNSGATLAAGIARLMTNDPGRQQRQQLRTAGPAWLARAYPPENMVDAHLALYEAVLTGWQHRSRSAGSGWPG